MAQFAPFTVSYNQFLVPLGSRITNIPTSKAYLPRLTFVLCCVLVKLSQIENQQRQVERDRLKSVQNLTSLAL